MLIDKNINKVNPKNTTQISSDSIAKLSKNEPVRMNVLIRAAIAMDCKGKDLFKTMS